MKAGTHLLFATALCFALPNSAFAELQAGAAVVDVTPSKFPVLVNGGMTSRTADSVNTRINARAIVLADGNERIGIVVVDSCMMPRPLLDEAKQLAAGQTQLKPDRILISATHTHTAPSSMGALGTDADSDYLPVLRAGIVEALVRAEKNLEPARAGWAVEEAAEFTALRRWIRRPDRLAEDPFGNMTVRANMHSGRNWNDVTGESGPEDPDLSLISFQALDGRPIAVLANFSMHYFSGQKPLAADYFGLFSNGLQEQLGHSDDQAPPFVGMMSHGCSGDIWRRDYKKPPEEQDPFGDIETYSKELLKVALRAYQKIQYQDDADLAMDERRMVLNYRVPDRERLDWAQRVMAEMGDRLPKTQPEVYAREQVLLYELQSTEIVVQGLRIGDIAIATTPNETYALTGLKIKHQSPLAKTMVIELANGGDGYIPPPEQHLLGGYNTWPARSAGLEVQAEPKITEAALQLLENTAEKPRRVYQQSRGPAAHAVQQLNPTAWFRLNEFSGPWVTDSSGHGNHATFEPAVAYFLDGPHSDAFCTDGESNRCVHFAGDRISAQLPMLKNRYSISMWIWNGMPADARPVSGWMFSRGHDHGLSTRSEHLGIGGTETSPGRLVYQFGTGSEHAPAVGTTEVARWTWNHVVLVRDGQNVRVFLNGNPQPEIDVSIPDSAELPAQCFFGGRCDSDSSWEGRLDEIAVFDKALSEAEIGQLTTMPGDNR
ncbi:MAG: LamG-like jellyroll fold domain-containing protein [Fuerstiella sp.]